MNQLDKLKNLISNDEICLGIIGLGYVGLPLAVLMAKSNIKTVGFEKSNAKVKKVNEANNYIEDVDDQELVNAVKAQKLMATADFSQLKQCDVIVICVPTPLDQFKKPDMSFIEAACIDIGKHMSSGTLISLESTTYPTTTEDFLLPIIESNSKKKHGEDFWLCYSPERVDPGNKLFKTENTPKVLGGLGDDATELGVLFYQKAIQSIHKVSSPRVAEMVKILENTYRLVNISMINELALLAGKMDIDIWEVIEAAKTKPFGYQAFYPGPGIGGHCIPLDPFYLEHIAKKYQFNLTMINTAGHIDMLMPHRMTIKINSALNSVKKAINGSKILFLGVAYKPDISDERESPALKIMEEVLAKGGIISYHDPNITQVKLSSGNTFTSVQLKAEVLEATDLVVYITKHSGFDNQFILEKSPLIVDLRNNILSPSKKVYKL